jgi:hypothetical protein
MRFFKYILVISLILTFSNCSKDIENIAKKEVSYPSWYLNPPQNNQELLYGIGEGFTINEATKNALENLSSRLMVTISSNTVSSSKSFTDYREYTTKTTTQDIKSEIEKLSFNNYKVEDSLSMDKRIIVLLSSPKNDISKTLQDQINTLYKELDFINTNSTKHDPLTNIFAYEKMLEKLYANYNKSQILADLNSSNNDKYIKTVDELKAKVYKEKSKIVFFITADNDSEIFKDTVKDNILKNKFKVIQTKENNPYCYQIDLRATSSRNNPYGMYIIDSILNIKILDNQNTQISSNSHSLKGASSQSFDDAKINLINKLKTLTNVNETIFLNR